MDALSLGGGNNPFAPVAQPSQQAGYPGAPNPFGGAPAAVAAAGNPFGGAVQAGFGGGSSRPVTGDFGGFGGPTATPVPANSGFGAATSAAGSINPFGASSGGAFGGLGGVEGLSGLAITLDQGYVQPKTVLLTAQQGKGLEIRGTYSRRQAAVQLELTLSNKALAPLSNFDIKMNKNTYVYCEDLSLSECDGADCLFFLI
jgi:hypothetical protein